MARRKSDAQVGPLGVWAYNTRTALDLSVEDVIPALPTRYHPATLRKVEGGSSPPGTRMWRELGNLYTKLADERHIPIDPQPRLTPELAAAPDLTQVLADLTEELGALRQERIALWRGLAVALSSPAGAHVATALRDALAPLLPEVAPQ